jgi:hypothetical protein
MPALQSTDAWRPGKIVDSNWLINKQIDKEEADDYLVTICEYL